MKTLLSKAVEFKMIARHPESPKDKISQSEEWFRLESSVYYSGAENEDRAKEIVEKSLMVKVCWNALVVFFNSVESDQSIINAKIASAVKDLRKIWEN